MFTLSRGDISIYVCVCIFIRTRTKYSLGDNYAFLRIAESRKREVFDERGGGGGEEGVVVTYRRRFLKLCDWKITCDGCFRPESVSGSRSREHPRVKRAVL